MTATSTITAADVPGRIDQGDLDLPAQRSVVSSGFLGFVGLVLVTVASAMRGWPFPSLTAAPWLYQFTTSNDAVKYGFLAIFVAGVVALCVSWTRLLRLAGQGDLSMRQSILILVAWTLPLLLAAPLFSGDAYVYLIDGDVLNRGFNPYESGISATGPADTTYLIHPLWRDTTSMYGPLFMRGMQGIATLADGNVVAGVLMIRVFVVLSLVLMVASVVRLSRIYGRRPGEALAFAVLNPITVLHLIGGAHNDGTMLSLLLAGFAVGVKARSWPVRLAAILLCVAAASFKVPALAGVLVLGWMWAGEQGPMLRRFVAAAIAGVIGAVAFELVTVMAGMGWGWTNALDVPGLAHPMLAPANAFALSIGGILGVAAGLNEITRGIATVASVALGVFLILRTGAHGSSQTVLRATGWALLGLAWLGPAVYPWYLSWGVAIVGVAGAGRLHRMLVAMVVAVSFAVAPGGYGVLDMVYGAPRTVVACATATVMTWAVMRIYATNGPKLPHKREV